MISWNPSPLILWYQMLFVVQIPVFSALELLRGLVVVRWAHGAPGNASYYFLVLCFGEQSKSCLGELKGRGHEPSGVALVTPGPLVIIPPETSVVRLNSKPFQGLHWEGPISKDCSPAWGGWGYWGGKPEGSYAALIPLPTTRVSSAQIVALPQHPRDLRQ